MKIEATAQKVVVKGKRTAVMDEKDIWYSTFDNIEIEEGKTYLIDYTVNKGFNNINSVTPINGDPNKEQKVVDKDAKITRMHSQDMALKFMELAIIRLDGIDMGEGLDGMKLKVKELADWFDEDVSQTNGEPF